MIIPTRIDLKQWYEDQAQMFPPGDFSRRVMYAHQHQVTRLERLLEILVENSLTGSGASCLEIGCSEGYMTERLSPLFGQITAIDISETSIRRAPDLPNVDYEAVAVEEFFHESDDEEWTIAILSEVLEHLPAPVSTLREVGAHVEYVLFSCPINERPNPMAFSLDLLGHETAIGDASGHIWSPDLEMLQRWAHDAGQTIVHVDVSGVTGIVLAKGELE